MSFFASQRPRERFVRVSIPAMYYFIHQLERANTKQFRMGESVEVGEFALCFKAKILDPSMIDSAMDDQIYIQVRLRLEDGTNFDTRGRVVWKEAVGDPEKRECLIGVEFTETDEELRDAFLVKAAEIGQAVDPSAA